MNETVAETTPGTAPALGPQAPRETAARHIVTGVPQAGKAQTVGTVLADLAGDPFDSVHAVYITDEDDRLLGLVRLHDLLAAGMQHRMGELMLPIEVTVGPDEDQERVVFQAVRHGVSEVPVVDGGRLLGVVPAKALLKIQHGEYREDFERLAGILRDENRAREAIEGRVVRRALRRLPWLLIGLIGGGLATWVMSAFEEAMHDRIALAFFVPGLVYLAGAIGTQSVTVAVRGLSVSKMSLRRLAVGELYTGLLIGLVLAAVTAPFIILLTGDMQLAIAVPAALVLAGAASTTIGLLLPWTLSAMGKDPAYGSGPIATILQDVLSLLAYFGVAALVVS